MQVNSNRDTGLESLGVNTSRSNTAHGLFKEFIGGDCCLNVWTVVRSALELSAIRYLGCNSLPSRLLVARECSDVRATGEIHCRNRQYNDGADTWGTKHTTTGGCLRVYGIQLRKLV